MSDRVWELVAIVSVILACVVGGVMLLVWFRI